MEEITSAVVKKIRALEPIVYRCLIKVPATRDDDKLLVLKIWAYQNPKLREKNFSFVDFSEGYLDGLYADSETITRTRRRVQQKHPETRGEKYAERHAEELQTRKDINKE